MSFNRLQREKAADRGELTSSKCAASLCSTCWNCPSMWVY